jgi:hypothetical protein
MNTLQELLAWYQGKGDQYREQTLLVDCVDDFLKQWVKKRIVLPCHNKKDVKENIVAIIGMMGNPNLKTKKDLVEIETIAAEIYGYFRR